MYVVCVQVSLMTRISTFFLGCSLFATTMFADSAKVDMQAYAANPLQVSMAVVNHGPDVARNSFLTIDFPPELVLDRVVSVYGPCDYTQRPVRCSLGDIPVFAPETNTFAYYLEANFKGPFVDASYKVTFTISSDTPDPTPSTNSASVMLTTKLEADLGVLIDRSPRFERIDPGQNAEFWTYVGNNVRGNKPPNVRIDYAVTNGVIEKIDAPSPVSCSIAGATAVCTISPLVENPNTITVTVKTTADRLAGKATLSMRAAGDVPDKTPANDQTENTVPIYRWYAVTTVADDGPGSLRDAIVQANANCTPGPCRIVFEIPPPVPAEGWFTITPAEPLPTITADRVSVEGLRQKAFTGDTNPLGPEIAIDGRLARRGLRIVARCEAVIEGLALGNFDEDQGLWFGGGAGCPEAFRPDRRAVASNYIGVDPTGTTAWPNLRGLNAGGANVLVSNNVISHNRNSGVWMWNGSAQFETNRIESNGASGIFLGPGVDDITITGNTISNHRDMGVAVARSKAHVEIHSNTMKNNGGLGIDWGLDGVSPVDGNDKDGPSNAPVLLSATYDAAQNRTFITLSIKSTPLSTTTQQDGVIDFYGNGAPDGEGEKTLGSVHASSATTGTITVSVGGDLRGQWINATWTRIIPNASDPYYHDAAVTSELSNAIFASK
ncbi:MAG TPA: right-handed parallel beta-helix repeat-containing protein, partial [Thermoanaerobaculia bacterium]|nr:right-handed parallel beta-helix repeat-containing protein [Thermoanaerobaculia bacterium]